MCIYNHILLLLISKVLKVQLVYRCGDVVKFTYMYTYIHACMVMCCANSQSVLIVSFCFLASLLWLLLLVF